MANGASSRYPFSMVRAGAYFTAIVLVCLNHWINRYFGPPDIDQIAYHLQFGTEGLKTRIPPLSSVSCAGAC